MFNRDLSILQCRENLPRRFWVAMPEKAAEEILNAAEKRRRQVYITRRWALVAWLFKRMPRSLHLRIQYPVFAVCPHQGPYQLGTG
jgi:short-subunit dehydrogenase